MSDFCTKVLFAQARWKIFLSRWLFFFSTDILTPFFVCAFPSTRKHVTRMAKTSLVYYSQIFTNKNKKRQHLRLRQSDPKIKNKINSQNRIDECLMLFFCCWCLLSLLSLFVHTDSFHLLRTNDGSGIKSDANNSKRRMRIDSPSLSLSEGKFLFCCLVILRQHFFTPGAHG